MTPKPGALSGEEPLVDVGDVLGFSPFLVESFTEAGEGNASMTILQNAWLWVAGGFTGHSLFIAPIAYYRLTMQPKSGLNVSGGVVLVDVTLEVDPLPGNHTVLLVE